LQIKEHKYTNLRPSRISEENATQQSTDMLYKTQDTFATSEHKPKALVGSLTLTSDDLWASSQWSHWEFFVKSFININFYYVTSEILLTGLYEDRERGGDKVSWNERGIYPHKTQ
jgi:hypothetical protein